MAYQPTLNQKYWRAKHTEYKKQFLDYEDKTSLAGITYPQFNYLEKNFAKEINNILSILRQNGFLLTDIIDIWHHKTGINKSDAKKKLNGKKEFPAWEFLQFIKCVGFDFNISHQLSEKYTSTIERDKLILKSNGLIKYVLQMNLDNYLDFEIEFIGKKILTPKFLSFQREIIQILEWYFLQGKNKKLPFKILDFKKIFKMKWYRGDFENLHHPKTKIIE